MSTSAGAPGAETKDLFAHPGVDVPTLALLVLMWTGLVGNAAVALGAGPAGLEALPGPVHTLIAVVFLNMSFTVWHEAVHGTVFRSRLANDVVGVLGAFPAMIPYFMIKTVHRHHHEFTNDPERDPDAWFNEGSIWSLPLRYPAGIGRAKRAYVSTHPPAWESWADRVQSLVVVALFALALLQGAGLVFLWCWFLPKLIAMWIHAWYVNYLPHRALPPGRYRDTRIFPIGWLSPLMLYHNYHGLHHAWQTVPWHRYGRAFRAKADFLAERGAPIRRRLSER